MLLKMLALLCGLFGVASLLGFSMHLAYGASFQEVPRQQVFYYVLFLGIWPVNAILGFALLYGLWRSERWARWLAIGVSTAYLAIGVEGFISARFREPDLKITAPAVVFALGCLLLFGGVIVICARRPRPSRPASK
jgi:hypothetical protein